MIEPGNGRRIVRALEVAEITGAPFRAALPQPGPPGYGALLLRLDRPTDELDDRLADRVTAMMAAGFLDEVRELADHGLRDGVTASRALGYRQLLQHLDGDLGLEDAVDRTIIATRRFVRRQRSWFRRDLRWIDVDASRPDALTVALATLDSGSS